MSLSTIEILQEIESAEEGDTEGGGGVGVGLIGESERKKDRDLMAAELSLLLNSVAGKGSSKVDMGYAVTDDPEYSDGDGIFVETRLKDGDVKKALELTFSDSDSDYGEYDSDSGTDFNDDDDDDEVVDMGRQVGVGDAMISEGTVTGICEVSGAPLIYEDTLRTSVGFTNTRHGSTSPNADTNTGNSTTGSTSGNRVGHRPRRLALTVVGLTVESLRRYEVTRADTGQQVRNRGYSGGG